MKWVSTTERWPEEDTTVLAYWPGDRAGGRPLITPAQVLDGKQWLDEHGDHLRLPTCWMPLPEPPEAAK